MKKFYFFLVIAMMAVATSASAQFVQSGANNQSKNNNQSGNFFSQMSTDNYSRIYVGYNPTKIKWEDNQSGFEQELPFKHGLTLGYTYGVNIVKNLPLYIEAGANFQYTFGKSIENGDEESGTTWKHTHKVNMYSLNIPVNLAFRFGFNNQKIEVTPYLGLNFRINLGGKLACAEEGNYYIGDDEYESISDSVSFSLFTTSEEGWFEGDGSFKHFQVGFNVGVNIAFSGFNIGVGYTTDFNKICDAYGTDGKIGVTTLSVGFAF